MANVKQIPSVLPDYIPPLASAINHDNIPWDFEYTLITVYLPKGICAIGPQLGHIPSLKNNDFQPWRPEELHDARATSVFDEDD
jgi:hypothetical protein